MGEVKRYENVFGRMEIDRDGDWVKEEDHAREVTRLQRSRLELFVRCLEMMAAGRQFSVHLLANLGLRSEQICRESYRLNRIARHIKAKYLEGSSNG